MISQIQPDRVSLLVPFITLVSLLEMIGHLYELNFVIGTTRKASLDNLVCFSVCFYVSKSDKYVDARLRRVLQTQSRILRSQSRIYFMRERIGGECSWIFFSKNSKTFGSFGASFAIQVLKIVFFFLYYGSCKIPSISSTSFDLPQKKLVKQWYKLCFSTDFFVSILLSV